MKEFYKLFKWMKGNYLSFTIAFLILVFVSYSRVIVPQFISFSIDELILNETTSELPEIFKKFIYLGNTITTQLILVGVILVVFQIFRSSLMLLRSFFTAQYAENTIYRVRRKLFTHLQKLPYNFFKTSDMGEILQKATTDVDIIRNFLSAEIVQLIWGIFIIISTAYMIFKINVTYTVVTLIVLPLLFIGSIVFTRIMYKKFTQLDKYEADMIDVLHENITGITVVKAFGSQKLELDKFTAKTNKYYDYLKRIFIDIAVYHTFADLLVYIQTFVCVFYGIYLVDKELITIGQFFEATVYIRMISMPVRMLGRIFSRFGRIAVAIKRVDSILTEKPEKYDGKKVELVGDIVFENVSFAYPDASNEVISDFNLTIRKGESVGIVGKSGSGKSTLTLLLARLYDVTSGKILINNCDITEIDKKLLRNKFGVLIQETYLFSKNVYENIAITNPKATLKEVEFFADVANIHRDILSFSQGYETEVGEKGVTLSGGQKQRIAIARMLLAEKSLLIFDDSLSAVDLNTDAQIRNELRRNISTTMLIISHRVASVIDCDRIIYLDNGRIVEEGSVEELLQKDSLFKKLYDKQLGGQDGQ